MEGLFWVVGCFAKRELINQRCYPSFSGFDEEDIHPFLWLALTCPAALKSTTDAAAYYCTLGSQTAVSVSIRDAQGQGCRFVVK